MNGVIDSDILIDVLRQQEKAKHFVETIAKNGNIIYISALTEAEVLSGKDCKEPERKEKTEELLSLFQVIDVTQALARKGAELRRNHDMPLHDAVIAATAIEMSAPLYSRNAADFRKIKELKLVVPY